MIVPPPLEEARGKLVLCMDSEVRVSDVEVLEVNWQFYVARCQGIAGHCLARALENPGAMSQLFFLLHRVISIMKMTRVKILTV